MDGKLIKKGAEANLILENWYDRLVIRKERVPKAYRVKEFDLNLRVSRVLKEAELIHNAKLAGVLTPTLYAIDLSSASIIMEYVKGKRVKEAVLELGKEERAILFNKIGVLIGKLHKAGIIHGDLTTSNMILTENGNVCFIDFGLGEISKELEDRGVDLHLMERALESTHYDIAKECFHYVMQGYKEVMGNIAEDVKKRISEIRKRARYVKR